MTNGSPQPRFDKVRLPDGLQLDYVEQGNPGGVPIIFLHGYSDSWYSFNRVLSVLPADFHAFALTQRGHGDSDKPDSGYTIDDFAADVNAFMDELEIPEATVVGASTGALFAERMAIRYPRRVSRLVLIGAQTPAKETLSQLVAVIDTLEDPVPEEFVREFQSSTIHHPVPDSFLEKAISESLKLPARVWRDYMYETVLAIDGDYVNQLREIAAPTLILWGDRDALFPREDQERLAAAINKSELRIYPDTGHAVHWERPEQVVGDLINFLSKV